MWIIGNFILTFICITRRNGKEIIVSPGLDWVDVLLAVSGVMLWLGMIQVFTGQISSVAH